MHPDELYMQMAMREAHRAGEAGEVPVGAVLVHPQRGIVGKAHNQVETLKDATAHAEILAITQASAALEDWRLEDCTLYVTKEPCPMCAGAIVFSRVRRVVWGLTDAKRGGETRFGILSCSDTYHRPDILSGWMEDPCKQQFLGFFRAVRNHEVQKPGAEEAPAAIHLPENPGHAPDG